jgi:hypothetical protein
VSPEATASIVTRPRLTVNRRLLGLSFPRSGWLRVVSYSWRRAHKSWLILVSFWSVGPGRNRFPRGALCAEEVELPSRANESNNPKTAWDREILVVRVTAIPSSNP